MKKSLLSLALLGLVTVTAQAQWVNQPVTPGGSSFVAMQVNAINATTGWAWGLDLTAQNTQFARTTNGGTTWTESSISNLSADELITSIHALDANTAWITTHFDSNGGGRILKTTNGGTTWTPQTTSTQFAGADSWPNLVYFFNATDGVAAGDPDGSAAGFEIYSTTNGGTTWTRVASVPAALSTEYGATGGLGLPSLAAAGNSIWFGTSEGRVYRSADRGLTWNVSNTNLNDYVGGLSFRNATTGLAMLADGAGSGYDLRRTTDGGATWTTVAYTGQLHGMAIDNVPGTDAFISVGADGADKGSSYSFDNGQTWVNLETTLDHTSVDMVSSTAGWSGSVDFANQMGTGLNRFTGTVSARRDAALQQALTVYPNPSRDGLFTLNLATTRAQATELRVTDALGREVYRTTLGAAATSTPLDLHQQKAGLYTLEVRSAAGLAQQKLVIQ